MSQRASPRIGEQAAAQLDSVLDSSLDPVLRLQCVLDLTLRPIHRSTPHGHKRVFATGRYGAIQHQAGTRLTLERDVAVAVFPT
jgi:hypothetical protein